MKQLKQIVRYLTWIIIAILLGIGYMRIILGANTTSTNDVGYLFHIFYTWGLLHVGAIIGGVIAALFILFDVFYLKKKLSPNLPSITTRFKLLFTITLVVIIIHYLLEKVIDVI